MPRPSLSCNVTLATLLALWGVQQVLQPELTADYPTLALAVPPLAGFLNSVVVGKLMDNHNKAAQSADELLRNGYLSRAVGRTIQAVTQKMAGEPEWERDAKSLQAFAKALPESWVNLLLIIDAKPSLARLQDTELPGILTGASGKNPEPSFLDTAQWKEMVGELTKAAKPSLPPAVIDALSERLTTGFIHALRQVLTNDDTGDAKAFRRIALDFFSDISRVLSDIDETTKRTEKNTQALLTDTGDLLIRADDIKANTERIVAMLEKELSAKNDQIASLMNQISQRSVPSHQAVALAEQIPDDAGNYALALKATAESRYDDAERLYRTVEADQEVERARVYNSHATNEFLALRYNEAVKYAQKAAALRPDDAIFQNRLGGCLYKIGRFAEANVAFSNAFSIDERVLGPKHPITVISLYNLAGSCAAQDKLDEAERLYVRALAIREEMLGPKHPDTVISLGILAFCYWMQGKWDKAEPLLVRALAIREEMLGPKHIDTATSLISLGSLKAYQKHYPEAERLLRRACEIREAVLGMAHPDTAAILLTMSSILGEQGKTDEAEAFSRRAVESRAAVRQLNPESSAR